jgi:hypothetical protein
MVASGDAFKICSVTLMVLSGPGELWITNEPALLEFAAPLPHGEAAVKVKVVAVDPAVPAAVELAVIPVGMVDVMVYGVPPPGTAELTLMLCACTGV